MTDHRPVRPLLALTLLLTTGLLAAPAAHAAKHSFGLGAHFFRTVDSVSDVSGIKDDGNSWVASYQYIPRGLFTLQADFEYFSDGFSGSTDTAFAPQVFLLIGHGLYGGIGVGQTFADDLPGNSTDPYFMARIGYELALLGILSVDIQGTYLFENWEAVGDLNVQTDTLTLGVVVRFRL
jgi:hypothetical protein